VNKLTVWGEVSTRAHIDTSPQQFLAEKGISTMDKLLQLTSDCFQTQDYAQREVFLAGKGIKLFMEK
jgi:hypothetical protein